MNEPFAQKDNEFVAWYPLNLTAEGAKDVWRTRRTGYYVHIPFCTAICDYCGFAVERLKGAPVGSYIEALKLEIRRAADSGRLARHRFVCGHFGGGTPSAIPAADLMAVKRAIDESFDVADDAEVTVEVNPISFSVEKAEAYRDNGVNRISFGVQSFDDRILKTIGRPHRASDVQNTLDVIRNVGFQNFSLDLIYGVPGQSLADLRTDLERAAQCGPTHISCFRLEIIPLTLLKLREAAYQIPARLSVALLDEMDDLVSNILTDAGYSCYGAFNFAKPGFESVHNSVAFVAPQGEYIGFGNSAYSFVDDQIFCNHAEVHAYARAVLGGDSPIALAARVTALESMARYFILGLKFFRVSRSAFVSLYGLEPEQLFGTVLQELEDQGLLVVDGEDYVLTALGRRYVNNVVKRFFVGTSRGRSQYPQFVSNLSVEQISRYADLRAKAEQSALS
ncbi:MAG: hypothetical protein QOK17_468 [Sphingomonadales bacterium]|nr:hypothetical protein [Sphingomonadales bacterium]